MRELDPCVRKCLTWDWSGGCFLIGGEIFSLRFGFQEDRVWIDANHKANCIIKTLSFYLFGRVLSRVSGVRRDDATKFAFALDRAVTHRPKISEGANRSTIVLCSQPHRNAAANRGTMVFALHALGGHRTFGRLVRLAQSIGSNRSLRLGSSACLGRLLCRATLAPSERGAKMYTLRHHSDLE